MDDSSKGPKTAGLPKNAGSVEGKTRLAVLMRRGIQMNVQNHAFAGRWPFAMLVVVVFLLNACGSSHYTVLQPANEPLANFEILEIKDFTSNLADADSIDLANRFADQLYTAVMEDRKETPGASIFRDVVRSTDETKSVLVLNGVVVSFDKGSRAKRYWIGFGAGKAFCTIQATFTNKETGVDVLKSNFDGELSMSFFGGSAEEAVDAVVDAFMDYFDDYFEH
jgi:hypothetical protein